MSWLWFFAGFGAFPIVYLGITLTPWHHLFPTEDGSAKECMVCEFRVWSKVRAWTKLTYWWRHRVLISTRGWHKRALAVWRVEVGRDPLTGQLLRFDPDYRNH